MKAFVAVLSVMGAVAIAIHLANSIPPDAIAMGMGVVMGALGTIPVSFLIGALIGRRSTSNTPVRDEPLRPYATQPPYPRLDHYPPVLDTPPVVIINPAGFQSVKQPVYPATAAQPLSLVGGPRQFRIIGDESS